MVRSSGSVAPDLVDRPKGGDRFRVDTVHHCAVLH